MKHALLLLVLACATVPSVAMKNRYESFDEPCDAIWKAAVAVSKTQDYRIISVSSAEQIISLAVGGAWWGERIISLSLAPGVERGCTVTVQSRYSGLQHSDAPDLLARIHIQLMSLTVDHESKAFKKFKACIDGYNNNETKCMENLRKAIAESAVVPPPHPDPPLWNKIDDKK